MRCRWSIVAALGCLVLASARLDAQAADTAAKKVPPDSSAKKAAPDTSTRKAPPDTAAKKPAPSDPRDSLFLRARAMVLNGNGAAGRALVDSALAAAADGTPEYGAALYWRAALAATAADAERDYRRVIVEYPFSAHSGDALLALAQLEMARGDRDPAIDHLERYLAQQPPHDPHRIRAGIWLGRLLLETNHVPKACAVLLRTRAALGDTAVEIRNQVDYYASRCAGVDTTATSTTAAVPPTAPSAQAAQAPVTRPNASPAPKAAPSVSKPESSVAKPRVPRPAAAAAPKRDSGATPNGDESSTGRYTVQVAAYDTKASALRLVTRLAERGIVARVAGTSAPFRVRIGHYPTDASATEAVRQLKTKGIEGFVTTTDIEAPSSERR